MGWLSRWGVGKRPPPAAGPGFKDRVESFWTWYAEVAPRFYETIEEGRCLDLTEEVSGKMAEWFPHLGWVFGPGPEGEGHSFTLTGEALDARQLLCEHWLSRAPELPGWTFYDARQPGDIEGHAIDIGELRYEAREVWLTPVVDAEAEKIDITIWHPHFATLDPRQRNIILFLWLDEALGERGTVRWIGQIEIGKEKLADAIPIAELRSWIEALRVERGWEEPTEAVGVTYKLPEPSDRALRADTMAGSTTCFSVVQDYMEAFKPAADDPVADLGAEFLFVAMDRRNLAEGDEVDQRYRISDAIGEAFARHEGGQALGGAMGTCNAYIDLLIYDGENSIDQIREVIRGFDLPHGATLHPFYQSRDAIPVAL